MKSSDEKNKDAEVPAAGGTADTASGANGDKDVPAVPKGPAEIGGRAGPDPTRYGDWEINGRCVDF